MKLTLETKSDGAWIYLDDKRILYDTDIRRAKLKLDALWKMMTDYYDKEDDYG